MNLKNLDEKFKIAFHKHIDIMKNICLERLNLVIKKFYNSNPLSFKLQIVLLKSY